MNVDEIKCAGGSGEYNLDCENPFGVPMKPSQPKIKTPKKTEPKIEISNEPENIEIKPKNEQPLPQPSNNFDEMPVGQKPSQEINEFANSDSEQIVPLVLSLPLGPRKFVKDTEPDVGGSTMTTKENAIKDFQAFFEDYKLLEARDWKTQLKGLNKLQTMLQEKKSLDDIAETIFRGLEKAPGFKVKISHVGISMIDIMRHVLVKSPNIRKASLAIIMPFVLGLLGDKKYGTQVPEFLLMVSQAICPSFVIVHVINAIADAKNRNATIAGTELCVQIIQKFGYGSISLDTFLPKLKLLLTNTNQNIKKPAILIASYLYKDFKDSLTNILSSSLSSHVMEQLQAEFNKANDLPQPTDKYYRTSTNSSSAAELEKLNEQLNKEKEQKMREQSKITDRITQQQINDGTEAKKWKDQNVFVQAVDAAVSEMQLLSSSDAEPVMAVLKQYLTEGNDRICTSTITVIGKMSNIADSGFSKYAKPFAPLIINKWTTSVQSFRDVITTCITTFATKFGPSPFIDAFMKLKESTQLAAGTRTSALQWISNIADSLSQSDKDKLQSFFTECANFKETKVREMADKVKNRIGISSNNDNQEQEPKSQGMKAMLQSPQKPMKQKKLSKGGDKQLNDAKQEEKAVETPRFVQATLAKKTKRLPQLSKTGLQLIQNKQALQSFADKCKVDSITHLPSLYAQKLFSNQLADQAKALEEIIQTFEGNETSFYMCSDIFLRWLVIKIFDKSVKIVIDGITFVCQLYNEQNQITLPEMECLVPVLLWCVEKKSAEIIDAAFDLLFTVRVNSDPSEYLSVLKSCLQIFSPQVTAHVLSEMQFCITNGQNNKDLFIELIPLASSNEIAVAAACGGVLAIIAQILDHDDRNQLFQSLSDEQIASVSPYVPINNNVDIIFDSFNTLQPSEKTRMLHTLIRQFTSDPEIVKEQAESIVKALSNELMTQNINLITIKPILFSLHEVIARCPLQVDSQKTAVKSVCFISNRYQEKLSVIEGIPTIINSILFKLFEKMPATSAYSALIDGMNSLKLPITSDSFYAKAWVVLTSRVVDVNDQNEFEALNTFMKSQNTRTDYDDDDIRPKLIQSVLTVVSKKQVPALTTSNKPIRSRVVPRRNNNASRERIENDAENENVQEKSPVKIVPSDSVLFKTAPKSENIASIIASPQKELDSDEENNTTQIDEEQLLMSPVQETYANNTSDIRANQSPRKELHISATPKKEQTPVSVYQSPIVLSSPVLDNSVLRSPNKTQEESGVGLPSSLLMSPSPLKPMNSRTSPKKISPIKDPSQVYVSPLKEVPISPKSNNSPTAAKKQAAPEPTVTEKVRVSPMKQSSKQEVQKYKEATTAKPTNQKSRRTSLASTKSTATTKAADTKTSTRTSTAMKRNASPRRNREQENAPINPNRRISTASTASTATAASRVSTTSTRSSIRNPSAQAESKPQTDSKAPLRARLSTLRKRWNN